MRTNNPCPAVLTALFLMLFLSANPALFGQKIWDGSVNNNWFNNNNWTPAGRPTATDDVIIPNGFNVNVNTAAVCASLTIEGGNLDNTLSINSGQSLTVSGAVIIEAGTQTGMGGDDKIIAVGDGTLTCGSISMANTTANAIDCEVTINTGTVNVTGNITMNGSAQKNAIRFLGSGALNVGGDVTGGRIIRGNNPIACTVNYNGSGPQIVNASPYHHLIFSGGGEKNLAGIARVRGNCTFSDGLVNSTTADILTFQNNATAFGASNNAYVNGPVLKEGNDLFTFPIGKPGTGYAPLTISAPPANTFYQAEYFNQTAVAGALEMGVDHISSVEYWTLDRTAGGSDVSVILSWRPTSAVTDPGTLIVVRYDTDANVWVNQGNGITTGNALNGTVSSAGTVSEYGIFTLGSLAALPANPLPIELISFQALLRDEIVFLDWSTATETNNDYFLIEKSSDGRAFEEVAKMPGAGNSTSTLRYQAEDKQPFPGRSYYRLKQVDYDGQFSYSDLVSINKRDKDTRFVVFPNPYYGGELTLQYDGKENDEVEMTIMDVAGKVYHRESRFLEAGQSMYPLTQLAQIPSGVYFVVISDGRELWEQRKLVVMR